MAFSSEQDFIGGSCLSNIKAWAVLLKICNVFFFLSHKWSKLYFRTPGQIWTRIAGKSKFMCIFCIRNVYGSKKTPTRSGYTLISGESHLFLKIILKRMALKCVVTSFTYVPSSLRSNLCTELWALIIAIKNEIEEIDC